MTTHQTPGNSVPRTVPSATGATSGAELAREFVRDAEADRDRLRSSGATDEHVAAAQRRVEDARRDLDAAEAFEESVEAGDL